MKVLLIFPPQKHNVSPSPGGDVTEEAGAYPPIGLLQLAAPVIASGRHEIKILDSAVEEMSYPQIEECIRREKPDLVGISCNTFYFYDAVLTARTAKKVNPEIIVVGGGPHIRLYPNETIQLKEFDYAILGEAESVFLPFLDALEKKSAPDNIPGVLSKLNPLKNAQTLYAPDIESLPIPDRRLLPYQKYRSVLTKGNPITIMMSSRGCPYACSFCASGRTKVRFRSAEKVIEEMKHCLDLGIRDILFFDELFNLNYQRAIDICERIILEGLNVRWHIRARAEGFDRSLLRKMKKAGCQLIQLGIESGTERVQKILGKNLNLKNVREIVRMARKEGILVYGNFMLGSPGETKEEMYQTIDFARELNLDYAVFSVTLIDPGTEFYRRVLEEKIVSTDFWRDFALNPDKTPKNIYWPVDFSKEELFAIWMDAFRKFYLRPGYFLNFLLRVTSLKQIRHQAKSAFNVFWGFRKGYS